MREREREIKNWLLPFSLPTDNYEQTPNTAENWKKLIFTGMLPLSVLYQTLQKPRKTLQLLKSYESTPNTAENWKLLYTGMLPLSVLF